MSTALSLYVPEQQFRREVATRFGEPVKLPVTTVALLSTAYPAADWTACLVYVSDGASNKKVVVSDGSVWRYPDGVAV